MYMHSCILHHLHCTWTHLLKIQLEQKMIGTTCNKMMLTFRVYRKTHFYHSLPYCFSTYILQWRLEMETGYIIIAANCLFDMRKNGFYSANLSGSSECVKGWCKSVEELINTSFEDSGSFIFDHSNCVLSSFWKAKHTSSSPNCTFFIKRFQKII